MSAQNSQKGVVLLRGFIGVTVSPVQTFTTMLVDPNPATSLERFWGKERILEMLEMWLQLGPATRKLDSLPPDKYPPPPVIYQESAGSI